MVELDDFVGDIGSVIRSDALSEFLLPFILIFAIVFAILQSTKILGAKKNIDAVIAMVFGLLFIRNQKILDFFNEFLPNISIVLLVGLAVLLIGGLIVGKSFKFGRGFSAWGIVFAIVIVIWIFRANFYGASSNLNPETKGLIAFIIILVVIVGFLAGTDGDDDKDKGGLKDFIFGKE